MQYNIFEPWKTLDPWQEKYIETEGNCFLLCGRQSGKTAAASIKFGKRAATKKNRIIMMIAETEKQAYNLFFKTLMYLSAKYPKMIKQGKDKKTGQKMSPTKHLIHLTNGSIIMCYAAGLEGSGLRTYTLTDLVIDEAAPMAREIFIATMPMLSVTGGTMDIMSTPRGAEGFFYDCSKDDDFTHFYVSAEDCSRHDKKFLEKQKKRMSELEYAQEYLAKFLSDLKRLFSDKWVKDVVTLKRRETTIKNRKYYLGSDIGGMGEDESSYEVFDKISKTNIEQVENITSSKNHIQENVGNITRLEAEYKFTQIGIDNAAGGGGSEVFYELLRINETKRKTIGLNNASKDLDYKGEKSTRILKVDMYMTTLAEGEHGRLKLLNDDDLVASLKSVQWEYTKKDGQKSKLRIFGNNLHIAEGIIRGVNLAVKDNSLKPYIF
ncbi:MAG TPA: hypothetical protein ENI22_02760 [Candidatus Pacearchaeota archaeon]|nr:hypothetical protein [Candidatus Pacearchaeota archaeon]